MGLNYSSTQFLRWEAAGLLTAIKPGNRHSSRVHYRWGQVRLFLGARLHAA